MKNAIREIDSGVLEVTLTQGKVALVDRADLELVAEHRWYALRNRRTFYAQTSLPCSDGKHTTLKMHRLILPGAEQIDHVNGNGLDNRRSNLRAATSLDNKRNERKRRDNTSGFKGVHWRKDLSRWRACIMVDGRTIHLGYHADRESAARAYDAAARERFGAYAAVNFPEPGERASG
jgi:hypothetical protein